jgi:AcrR family transcriptional regulator
MPKANDQSNATNRPTAAGDGRTRAPGETRDALLAATATAIAQSGWSAVTTRQVASIAGVNPGLVHYHFGSMDALRRQAVLAAMADELEGPMGALLQDVPLPDAVATCVKAVTLIDPETDRFGLLYEAMLEASRDEELRIALAGAYGGFREVLAARIRDAGGANPDAAASVLIAALDGMLLQRMVAPDLHLQGLTPTLIAALQLPVPGTAHPAHRSR